MFARLVYESFRRQKRRKLLAGAAITLGVTVATAMIAVATDIGDKINRELRTIGANLLVTPEEDSLDVEIGGINLKPPSDGAFLNEADLPKIKGTFWHNNITGFAPMLPVNVALRRDGHTENLTLLGTYFARQVSFGKEAITTGVRSTHPWWKVRELGPMIIPAMFCWGAAGGAAIGEGWRFRYALRSPVACEGGSFDRWAKTMKWLRRLLWRRKFWANRGGAAGLCERAYEAGRCLGAARS